MANWFRNILSLLVLMMITLSSIAQKTYSIEYTTKNGLSSNEVYWVMQAKNGLLWIGSDDGLASFDGVSYRYYKAPQAANKSMTGIFEDNFGRIWAHNFANQIYYLENDSLHLWEVYDGKGRINKMLLEGDHIIVKHAKGYWGYDLRANVPTALDYESSLDLKNNQKLVFSEYLGFQLRDSLGHKEIPCPACFYRGVTRKGLNYRRLYQAGTLLQKDELVLFYINNNTRPDLLNDKEPATKANRQFPFVYQLEQDSFKALQLPRRLAEKGSSFSINKIKIINDSLLWIASSDGLCHWNIHTNALQQYFPNTQVNDVLEDHEKNIWVTTGNKGLRLIPSLLPKKYDFVQKHGAIEHLERDVNNGLLVAYENGYIAYWDLNQEAPLFEYKATSKRILSIHYHQQKHEFLICLDKEGLLMFNPTNFNYTLKKEIGGNLHGIDFDNLGNYLAAYGHGAHIYGAGFDSKKIPQLPESWRQSDYERRLQESLINKRVGKSIYLCLDSFQTRAYDILWQEQPEYTIWVANVKGLRYYRAGKARLLKNKDQAPIIAKKLASMGDGFVWVGTVEDGVYGFKDDKIIYHLDEASGLLSNEIRDLKVAGNLLWIVSQGGLVRYNTDTKELFILDRSSGLPVENIRDLCVNDKEIIFTNGETLIALPLDYVSSNVAPLVEITQFKANNSAYPIMDNLEFAYSENNIQVEFRGISFRSQEGFKYKYRLIGVEEDWNLTNSKNTNINYPDLKAGDYTFEVVVVNTNGKASEPARLSFKIGLVFYQEWWFIALSTVLFFLALLGLFRRQAQKNEAQNEEKLRQSRLERDLRISELKALKAQLNPHFIFNALNSIQEYILMNEKELASNYLGMFADLMRLYLDHSKENYISLKEELDALRLYLELESIRMENSLEFDIQIDPKLNATEYDIPTMLLQPYVENAIKHGLFYKKGKKKLSITLEPQGEDFIKVLIQDNGIGRKAAGLINERKQRVHKSHGTSANQSRLDLLNYNKTNKIEVEIIDLEEGGLALGTVIHVLIPVD